MNFPHDLSGWLTFVAPWLIFLATSTVVAARLSRFAPHSVCLSGQRAEDALGKALWYRFAVQNNEDVSLIGSYKLTISILDEGRFLDDDGQKLFIGRNILTAAIDAGRRAITLGFNELPAYDTWSIECRTDDQARSLSVCIENSGGELAVTKPIDGGKDSAAAKLLALPAVLSHTRLYLGRDRDTAFEGAAFTPEGRWAAAAGFIAILSYSLRVAFRHVDWWDVLPPVLLALFAWGLWYSIRRPAPSICQGYWTATPLSDLLAKPQSLEISAPSNGNAAAAGA
jgi:hypothetical protein